MENLQIWNMPRSVAGMTDTPGRTDHAKSGLNKSILDKVWFEYPLQLDYNLAWHGMAWHGMAWHGMAGRGGRLVTVPPQNTSCTYQCCGHVSADNRRC
jgi:putative transposase